MPHTRYPYAAYFCEENIWMLAQHPELAHTSNTVCLITNAARRCPLWAQRASLLHGDPILWDYHVVLISQSSEGHQVWDLDSLLGCPIPLPTWWRGTFPLIHHLPPELLPSFRLLPGERYITTLSSDRSHMRDQNGAWRAPPPPWPMIYDGHQTTLQHLIDLRHNAEGDVFDARAFCHRFDLPTLRPTR